MFNLNTRSAFLLSHAVLPGMVERKFGNIVNVAAKSGLKGLRNGAGYSGAKAAVLRLTESLASEVKHLGINVNAIIPGAIDTPENQSVDLEGKASRWVTMEAVIDVILFLISNQARAIHAAAIVIEGPETGEKG